MKRSLIIIIGIVVVVALMAMWIYVLFLKTTPPPNTFSNLDIGDTTDSSVFTESETISSEPLVDVTSQKSLRQLTVDPVIGFQEVYLEGAIGFQVYYVESGTGHIYHINLKTGEQKRVSATTVPSSQKGEITMDGNFALIQSGFGSSKRLVAGTLSSTSDNMSTHFIDGNVVDFKSTTDNTFLYLVKEDVGLVGKEYLPLSKTSRELFRIPFTEAAIYWGMDANSTHYIYPKPSSKLEGYVYTISNNRLGRLPMDGFGISAVGNSSAYVLKSGHINNNYSTFIYNDSNSSYVKSSLTTLPEKCTALGGTADFICASTHIGFDENTPDSWYKGNKSYSDGIWRVSAMSGNATLLSDTKVETGREVDIINPRAGNLATNIYFQNKNDKTLWLYELVKVNFDNNQGDTQGEMATPTDNR